MTNPYKYILRKDNHHVDVEHRFIMEQSLGRKLTYNEVVHHKDGNQRNNKLSNLEVQTRSSHSSHHSKPNSIIGVRCAKCNKITFKLRRTYIHLTKKGVKNFYCSRQCSDKINLIHIKRPKKVYCEENLTLSEIVLKEYKKGKNAYQIAKEFGIKKENVYYMFKKLNLQKNYVKIQHIGLKEKIIKNLKKGLNGAEIAKKYRINKSVIYYHIKRLNTNDINDIKSHLISLHKETILY